MKQEFDFVQGLKDAGFVKSDAKEKKYIMAKNGIEVWKWFDYFQLSDDKKYKSTPENLKLLIEAADILGKLKKAE